MDRSTPLTVDPRGAHAARWCSAAEIAAEIAAETRTEPHLPRFLAAAG